MTGDRARWSGSVEVPPFRLVELVATGRNAHVFRGVHDGLGLRVAVKVLEVEPARAGALMATFRDELAALADLDHPHVAAVFDHGQIDPSTARAIPDLLAAGAPYFVMEWASGGTLAHRRHARSFAALRETLLALLDALGHVHARGVVHRDVKPANVLLCSDRDPRPGPKLADFGIARRAERLDSAGATTSGTPPYMAPEQITGSTRDEGPWTDLYALGCLAYRMAAGHSPFQDRSRERVLRAHLVAEVPPLTPLVPVPDGFAGWLATLLAKSPRDRFRCAADAARALERLGGRGSTSTRPVTRVPAVPSDEITLDLTIPTGGAPRADSATHAGASVPRDWRRAGEAPLPWGRGLRARSASLVGLRSPAIVGRERERDALWRALVDVHGGAGARVLLVEGPPGVGKTRLLTWLARRAAEVGAATALRADAWSGGILPALARRCGVIGLGRGPMLDRLRAVLGAELSPSDRSALADLFLAGDVEESGRAYAPPARHELVGRAIRALARERPVVLVVDDAHAVEDDLACLLRVARDDVPLVAVCAHRPDAFEPGSVTSGLLEALRRPRGPSSSVTCWGSRGPSPRGWRSGRRATRASPSS